MKTKRKTNRAARRRTVGVAALNRSSGAGHREIVPLRERRLTFGEKWDYAPAPETSAYIKLPLRHDLFINGRFIPPHSGQYFESLNPATEEKLSEIATADDQDVDNAVRAARQAYN